MRLEGKRIVVTGASRGIGRALTAQLAGQGATVLAVARDPSALAGDRIVPVSCDLADMAARQALIAQLIGDLAPIDGLINNAGIQLQASYLDTPCDPASDIDREIAINLAAPLHLSAALAPHLASRPEAILLNVTSGLALTPKASAPVYCATKAGLRSFTTALRYQAEDRAPNLRVGEIVMALVDTEMTTGRGRGKLSADQAAQAVIAGIERQKWGDIWVGNTRLLRIIQRLSPALAARMLRNG